MNTPRSHPHTAYPAPDRGTCPGPLRGETGRAARPSPAPGPSNGSDQPTPPTGRRGAPPRLEPCIRARTSDGPACGSSRVSCSLPRRVRRAVAEHGERGPDSRESVFPVRGTGAVPDFRPHRALSVRGRRRIESDAPSHGRPRRFHKPRGSMPVVTRAGRARLPPRAGESAPRLPPPLQPLFCKRGSTSADGYARRESGSTGGPRSAAKAGRIVSPFRRSFRPLQPHRLAQLPVRLLHGDGGAVRGIGHGPQDGLARRAAPDARPAAALCATRSPFMRPKLGHSDTERKPLSRAEINQRRSPTKENGRCHARGADGIPASGRGPKPQRSGVTLQAKGSGFGDRRGTPSPAPVVPTPGRLALPCPPLLRRFSAQGGVGEPARRTRDRHPGSPA